MKNDATLEVTGLRPDRTTTPAEGGSKCGFRYSRR